MRFARAMRFRAITLGILILSCASCGRRPAKVVVPPLPRIEIADVPAPRSATVVVEKGSNLRAIAWAAYFHEDFSGFVGVLNGVAAPEKLQAGAVIKTPSLPVALRDSGLDARYQPATNALAKAWIDFAEVLPAYIKSRNDLLPKDAEKFPIPAEMQMLLVQCADKVDAAIDVLKHPVKGHKVPLNTIARFKSASDSLRMFSRGEVFSLDYDTFLAGKGFGLGFTQLLIWVQDHHQ